MKQDRFLVALTEGEWDKVEFFKEDIEPEVWAFTKSFYDRTGRVPEYGVLKERFPFLQTPSNTPYAFYKEEREKELFVQRATPVLERFNEEQKDDFSGALLRLRDGLEELKAPKDLQGHSLKRSVEQRIESFTVSAPQRLQTGIQPLDAATGGLERDEFFVVSARLGIGKALRYGTKVLTPNGEWRFVEDMKVGEFLVGRNGLPTRIKEVRDFNRLELYRISFTDGTQVDCCKDHLWTLKKFRKGLVTVTTEEISKKYFTIDRRTGWRTRHYHLPQISPVQFRKKEFVIPPYVMGVLLGDGGFHGDVVFTNDDDEIVEGVSQLLPRDMEVRSNGMYHAIVNKERGSGKNLYTEELKRLGLMHKKSYEKWVPKDYIYSDVNDRLELLAGLIDTDGYAPGGGRLEIQTSSLLLYKGIKEIVESVGGFVRAKKYLAGYKSKKTGELIQTRDTWTVALSLPMEIGIPLRGRKRNKYHRVKTELRAIDKVEKIDSTGGRCFIVDADDHLFLTEGYIPTHNSWIGQFIAANVAKQGKTVLFYSGEMTEEQVGSRIDTIWAEGAISNFLYTRNRLTEEEKALLKEKVSQVQGDIIVFTPKDLPTSSCRPSDVGRFMRLYNPDVVILDQISLMEPDGKRFSSDQERKAELSYQLKILQERSPVPFILISQLNRAAQTEEATAANIAGSDRIGQDASLVIALKRREDRLRISILKARSFAPQDGPMEFVWDVDRGSLTPALSGMDAVRAKAQQARQRDERDSRQEDTADELSEWEE